MNFSSLWFLLSARCDKVTHVLSDECDGRPPRVERWAAWLHLLSCGSCRRFRQQLRFLQRVFASMPASARERYREEAAVASLTPEAAARLSAALHRAWREDEGASGR